MELPAISMDMSVSYRSAVTEILPNIPVVFDRYHVMALMNRQIDSLRRELQNCLDDDGKKTLKGSRFLLLKNYANVPADHRAKLDTILEVNRPLYIIHTMKELLRLFWEQKTYHDAVMFLVQWCLDALDSGVKQLRSVGYTLVAHIKAVLPD